MCHDNDSRPPAPPAIGEVGETGPATLGSRDRTTVSAAFSMPVDEPRAGIVVLPDVRGLHPYYIALTERLAEAGLAAVAVDYFARTAGAVDYPGGRPDDFDWGTHLPQTTPEGVDADTSAAIAFLRQRTRPDLRVLTVGFCWGGSNAWRQSASDLDLAGCVGFYGQPKRVGDAAERAHLPVLMLIAGADTASTPESQVELADVMRRAGADVEHVVYDGAPHSFFDRSFADWQEACDDVWLRLLAFIARVTEPARG